MTQGPSNYQLMEKNVSRTHEEKDIGVIVENKLKFEKHVGEKVKNANSIFAIVRRLNLTIETFVPLYKSMVRSQLDYTSAIWSPYRKS